MSDGPSTIVLRVLMRIGVRPPVLVAVGRVLRLRVVCGHSEQGENLNLVPIFAQFREPGKNTQRKCDVLMKWTSLTGKR